MSHLQGKNSFPKVFIIATFVYLWCPVIVQNFKKILGVDSKKHMYKVFVSVCDENDPF